MFSTLQASVFMEKNYSDNLHSIKNTEDVIMKQMFEISEKLIAEQSVEIYGINTISWEDSSWKYYLWLVMKKSSVSCTQRSTYFQILCYALENEREPIHQNTELWTQLTENRWNSSGIFSQDSLH